jgi:hypothetical protein
LHIVDIPVYQFRTNDSHKGNYTSYFELKILKLWKYIDTRHDSLHKGTDHPIILKDLMIAKQTETCFAIGMSNEDINVKDLRALNILKFQISSEVSNWNL